MSTLQPIAPVYGTKDQPYLSRCLELPFTPIFILGEHRSGTTILYQLLANSGCFNYVHFLYIHRYDEILANHFEQRTAEAQAAFRAWLLEIGLQDRSFDRVQVTPELPEEYSFILKRFGSFWAQPRLTQKKFTLVTRTLPKNSVCGCAKSSGLAEKPMGFSERTTHSAAAAQRQICVYSSPSVRSAQLQNRRQCATFWHLAIATRLC
jgi:hypothetical protein